MSPRYPCPNPACTHEFTPQDLTGVAAVTCPACGMMIQLRPAASAPAATAAGPTHAPPVVRAGPRRRPRDWLTYALVIGGFLLLAAFGVVGVFVGFGGFGKILEEKRGYRNSDFNFRFNPGPGPWEDNPGMKARLAVSQFALRRRDAEVYFALDVIDYKDHDPTPRALDDEARRKLKALFTKNLETEPARDAPPAEAEPVASRPAHRVRFLGQTPERAYAGAVVFFADQGLGYWLYGFAPEGEAEALDPEFKRLRDGLALLGERAGWKKVQERRTDFTGEMVKGYQLTDTTGRWKKDNDPAGHDPQADLVLRAVDPAFPKQPTLGADLVVMNLKSNKDPVEAAKAHVLAKHQREGYPDTKIADAYAGGDGPQERVGGAPGHLLRWRVDNGGGRLRFALVGVVPRGDDLLVLYGECPWERRANWEGPLQRLIESLQLAE